MILSIDGLIYVVPLPRSADKSSEVKSGPWRILRAETCLKFKHFYQLDMKHRWSSGRILACHAGDPGSIPGRCTFLFCYFLFFYCYIIIAVCSYCCRGDLSFHRSAERSHSFTRCILFNRYAYHKLT